MSIVRNFNLYLNAGNGSAPYINVNQYDQGEQWVFTLYKEDGTKYTPSTGAIVGIKADNLGIINTGTVDADGRVVINETQQMTAAAGIAIFELLIDGDSHGTANFLVNVEQRPGDNADLSDSDLSLIQQAVNSAEVIVEVIGDSDPSEVIGEHVDDWLDNHPEATTTVLDGAITAPKLNNSLWDKLLVSESASGAVASFDDGADDVPVSSLKVALEPIQTGSGDPSPTNIRPIIASNGKNLLPCELTATTGGKSKCEVDGGIVTVIGTAVNTTSNTYNYGHCTLDAGTYKFNGIEGGGGSSYYLDLKSGSYSGTRITYITSGDNSFTLSQQTDVYVVISIGTQFPQAIGDTFIVKPMIRLASITDSSYQPYQGIMVTRTGINQWDEQWEVGYYGSTGQPNNTSGYIRSKNFIPVTPNATYYCRTGTASNFCLQFYGQDKAFISQSYNYRDITVTIPSNAYYVRFWRNENAYNNDISINYPSTKTEYHAYNGNTYQISLGQTVYGGTVDLATGVLTVTNGIVTDFSALASNGTSSTGAYRYKLAVAGVAGFTIGEAKCNMLKFKAGFNDDAGEFCNATDVFNIFLVDSTVASAITTLTGCQIVYPLATPQTIQLTPTQVKTLLGYNNISSSGTVDVIYHADTKLYVDKEVSKAKSIIAGIEAEFKATKNYTTGDLLIIGDDLYKCTANIANGSTITLNTNVTKTTVAEQLIALA